MKNDSLVKGLIITLFIIGSPQKSNLPISNSRKFTDETYPSLNHLIWLWTRVWIHYYIQCWLAYMLKISSGCSGNASEVTDWEDEGLGSDCCRIIDGNLLRDSTAQGLPHSKMAWHDGLEFLKNIKQPLAGLAFTDINLMSPILINILADRFSAVRFKIHSTCGDIAVFQKQSSLAMIVARKWQKEWNIRYAATSCSEIPRIRKSTPPFFKPKLQG